MKLELVIYIYSTHLTTLSFSYWNLGTRFCDPKLCQFHYGDYRKSDIKSTDSIAFFLD